MEMWALVPALGRSQTQTGSEAFWASLLNILYLLKRQSRLYSQLFENNGQWTESGKRRL